MTAVLPLITSILPTAIPLVVQLVEKIFGSKGGQQKLDAATEITAALQNGLMAASKATGTALTGQQIQDAVQSAVNALNAAGVLKGSATPIGTVPIAPTPAIPSTISTPVVSTNLTGPQLQSIATILGELLKLLPAGG